MNKTVTHTGNYKHWSGTTVKGIKPPERVQIGNKLYCINDPDDENWTCVGYAPQPKTRGQYFWWDVYNGLIMKYDFVSVMTFAIKHYVKNTRKGRKYQ